MRFLADWWFAIAAIHSDRLAGDDPFPRQNRPYARHVRRCQAQCSILRCFGFPEGAKAYSGWIVTFQSVVPAAVTCLKASVSPSRRHTLPDRGFQPNGSSASV